jgi:hypothetical protein
MYNTTQHFLNCPFPSSGEVLIHQKKETDVSKTLCGVVQTFDSLMRKFLGMLAIDLIP